MFPYLRSIKDFREDFQDVLKKNNNKMQSDEDLNDEGIKALAESIQSLISFSIKEIDDREKKSWILNMINMNNALKDVNANVKIAFEYVYDYRIGKEIGNGLKGYARRADVMLGGKNKENKRIVIVLELKSWSAGIVKVVDKTKHPLETKAQITKFEKDYSSTYTEDYVKKNSGNLQLVYKTKEKYVDCENPFNQIMDYCKNIQEENSKVNSEEIQLLPLVWLYNYNENDNENNGKLANIVIEHWANEWEKNYGKTYREHQIYFNKNNTDELNKYIKNIFNKAYRKNEINDVFSEFKKGFSDYNLCTEVGNIIDHQGYLFNQEGSLWRLKDGLLRVGDNGDKIRLRGDQYNCLNEIIKIISKLESSPERVITVSGGVGSGKSLLALLLYRYCIEQLADFGRNQDESKLNLDKICFVCPQGAELNAYKHGNENERFWANLMTFRDFKNKYNETKKCKIAIIDEAHNLFDDDQHQQYEYIIKNSEMAILFYDNEQAAGYNYKVFDGEPDFLLCSHFRCNKDEGYLKFIDDVLNNRTKKPLSYYGVDFDVRLIESLDKPLVDERYVFTCISQEADEKIDGAPDSTKYGDIEYGSGKKLEFYDDYRINPLVLNLPNGKYGTYFHIRGLEVKNVIIYLKKEVIYYSDKRKKIQIRKRSKIAKTIIKQRLAILLTRALQSCYIYCEDEKLREYLNKERGIPFVKKDHN